MLTHSEKLVFQHLDQFVSDHKKHMIEKVLSERTRYITVVLEDIFQSQNASAVIRTCECMGIQDIHLVENITKYSINPKVLRGSNKWIDIHHYAAKSENNTISCMEKLKGEGYKILVAHPDEGGIPHRCSKHCGTQGGDPVWKRTARRLRGGDEACRSADTNPHVRLHGKPEHFSECGNLS